MRHDWIFDVLTDLRSYALRNGLPALAAKADDALAVARAEIAQADQGSKEETDVHSGIPPGGRAH